MFALDPEDNYRPNKVIAEILRDSSGELVFRLGNRVLLIAANSFLDDEAPKDLLATDPDRVLDAAGDEVREGIYR